MSKKIVLAAVLALSLGLSFNVFAQTQTQSGSASDTSAQPQVVSTPSQAVDVNSIRSALDDILRQIQQLKAQLNSVNGGVPRPEGRKPVEYMGPPVRDDGRKPFEYMGPPVRERGDDQEKRRSGFGYDLDYSGGYLTIDELPWVRVPCVLPPLRQGSKGGPVYLLQITLKNAGFYPEGLITGYYGALTKKAVSNFQKSLNISPNDGFVVGETLTALNKLVIDQNPGKCSPSSGGIKVVSPTFGDVWERGKTYKIVWISQPISVEPLSSSLENSTNSSSGSVSTIDSSKVRISLVTPRPACLNANPPCLLPSSMTQMPLKSPYVISEATENDGSYEWTVPKDLPEIYNGDGQVVIETLDGSLRGQSAFFRIGFDQRPVPSIEPPFIQPGVTPGRLPRGFDGTLKSSIVVKSPAKGDIWIMGKTYEIQWERKGAEELEKTSSAGVSTVNILLSPISCQNSQSACPMIQAEPYLIAKNVPFDKKEGSYKWLVPADLKPVYVGQNRIIIFDSLTGRNYPSEVFYVGPEPTPSSPQSYDGRLLGNLLETSKEILQDILNSLR
jgi:hypothetical protein